LEGGTAFAQAARMSGSTVSRALYAHFDRIRQSELERLEKKLRGLTPDDRRSVEAMTAEVIHAIARVPERHIAADASPRTLEALVQLFALE
jgi:glutamyl-tRNA reductase